MTNIDNFIYSTHVDSILTVKASGSIDHEIINDLLSEPTKSIAELINDQEKTPENR